METKQDKIKSLAFDYHETHEETKKDVEEELCYALLR
jgi:hypothetical protein